MRNISRFFDHLEDQVRRTLSRRPIIYTFIGGVGIVLFWRGVWQIADEFAFMTGLVSLIASIVILLATGLFVSFFIGDEIIIKGLREEKKISEKTEEEIKEEEITLEQIKKELAAIREDIKRLQ